MTPFARLVNRLAGDPGVARALSRLPLLRRLVAREGMEIFDLMQGFVRAQVLFALVETGVLERLRDGPSDTPHLARETGLPPERLDILLRAGRALGLLARDRGGAVRLSRRGAVFLAVPGLPDMVRHHAAFYADMADPVALLRGTDQTHLSSFWPYVHGAAAAGEAEVAARYSDLMARSQALVAEDTLAAVPLGEVRILMDVGGGSGAFLAAAGARWPHLRLRLFDLPQVAPLAEDRMRAAGLEARFDAHPGSFRDEALPRGADAISLVRVLYDHDDATVADLLARVYDALPPGGRVIVSEPMSGGEARPDPATDVYFAFYTLAMTTGRTRSAAEIAALLGRAGFVDTRRPRPRRPYVTSVVEARRPQSVYKN